MGLDTIDLSAADQAFRDQLTAELRDELEPRGAEQDALFALIVDAALAEKAAYQDLTSAYLGGNGAVIAGAATLLDAACDATTSAIAALVLAQERATLTARLGQAAGSAGLCPRPSAR